MLKNATGCVLGSKQSSTHPQGYASGCFFICGLAREGARLGAPGRERVMMTFLSIL